jgi:hypothetical protein
MTSIIEAKAKRPTIAEFKVGKGRTGRLGDAEEWQRGYLELTIRLPEWFTEEDFLEALSRAEGLIDRWLEEKEKEKEKERGAEGQDREREAVVPVPVPVPVPVQAQASTSTSTLKQAPKPSQILQAPRSLDPKALEALPWKDRDGSPSKPGKWGWIHGPGSFQGPEPEASGLIRALDASPEGRIALGDYEYAYSKERAFIHRRPLVQSQSQSQTQSQSQNQNQNQGQSLSYRRGG